MMLDLKITLKTRESEFQREDRCTESVTNISGGFQLPVIRCSVLGSYPLRITIAVTMFGRTYVRTLRATSTRLRERISSCMYCLPHQKVLLFMRYVRTVATVNFRCFVHGVSTCAQSVVVAC